MGLLETDDARRIGRLVTAFDDAVDRRVEGWRRPALDHVAYPLSRAADHSLLWHGLGLSRAIGRRDPTFALRLSAAMGIESLVTNVLVKSAFRRLRPDRPSDAPLLYGLRQPITSSFPSGHATAAFCAATLLAAAGGNRHRAAWYVFASLVASTRVYVRLHHASDVVAGAALGVALGRVLTPVLTFRFEETR
jgi:undecaprenyl-diphosphatase